MLLKNRSHCFRWAEEKLLDFTRKAKQNRWNEKKKKRFQTKLSVPATVSLGVYFFPLVRVEFTQKSPETLPACEKWLRYHSAGREKPGLFSQTRIMRFYGGKTR